MTEDSLNDTEPSYAEAVREAGGVWANGNACPLDEGVSAVKHQLEAMRAAQAAQQHFAVEQLGLTMGQQVHSRLW